MNEVETVTGAQVGGAPYSEARTLYRKVGWTLTNRPAEHDGERQPRLDALHSNMVVIEIPSGAWHGTDGQPTPPAVEALSDYRATCALDTNSGAVALIYAVPELPAGAPRRLELDMSLGASMASFRTSEAGNLVLPCQGSRERWVHFTSPLPAPAFLVELASQLAVDEGNTDRLVASWLQRYWQPAGELNAAGTIKRDKGDPITGVTRDEVFAALLSVTSWSAREFSKERLSRAADLAGFDKLKHRTSDGYIWQIQRKPGLVLAGPEGVSTETIDPVLLEAARALHVVREGHPARVKALKEEQALAEQRAKVAADVRRRFGNEETRDLLCRRQPVVGIGGGTLAGVMYSEVHTALEYKRRLACEAVAAEYVALPFSESRPEWYRNVDLKAIEWPGLYRHIVQRFAVAKEVA